MLFVVFLATLLVPLEATIVVNRRTVDSLGWLNSYQGLIVPLLASAFGMFLLRQALMSLPKDLRDAALIDGVGHVGFLRHVAVPLVRPTLAALAVFAFLGTWNSYLWPNLITTEERLEHGAGRAAPAQAQALDEPNLVMAGTIIAAIPIAVVLLVFQRQLIRGLTSGAVKGMNITRRSTGQPSRLPRVGVSSRLAACASGQSILQAGNDGTTTTVPQRRPRRPRRARWTADDDLPRRTVRRPRRRRAGLPTTILLFHAGDGRRGPTGLAAAPGVTVSLAGTPDFAPCPVDALDRAAGRCRSRSGTGCSRAPGGAAALTDEYNASQDRVVVELQNQNGYEELIDKYFQSSGDDRPNLVQLPEYMLQQMADTNTVVSTTACIQAEGYDTSTFLPRALLAYQTGGVQWGMPFNISNPVLYYRKAMFEAAGLDPDDPPVTLDELREYSEQIVESGAATYGLAFDSGVNSGGGWFLEQWLARAGLPYADNGNGRKARATQVLFDTPEAADMLTFAQDLVTTASPSTSARTPPGLDGLLQIADQENPAAMGIATSGALGSILSFVEGGLIPGMTWTTSASGRCPAPPTRRARSSAARRCTSCATRATPRPPRRGTTSSSSPAPSRSRPGPTRSGYAPIREDATSIEPIAATYADDPRYRVAFDQVNFAADDFSAVGPVLGPLRQVRGVTAQMMADIYGGTPVEDALAVRRRPGQPADHRLRLPQLISRCR